MKLIFDKRKGMTPIESLRFLHKSIPERLEYHGLTFNGLNAWPLRISDVEHWACETWKYIKLASLLCSSPDGKVTASKSVRPFDSPRSLEPPVLPWQEG